MLELSDIGFDERRCRQTIMLYWASGELDHTIGLRPVMEDLSDFIGREPYRPWRVCMRQMYLM